MPRPRGRPAHGGTAGLDVHEGQGLWAGGGVRVSCAFGGCSTWGHRRHGSAGRANSRDQVWVVPGVGGAERRWGREVARRCRFRSREATLGAGGAERRWGREHPAVRIAGARDHQVIQARLLGANSAPV